MHKNINNSILCFYSLSIFYSFIFDFTLKWSIIRLIYFQFFFAMLYYFEINLFLSFFMLLLFNYSYLNNNCIFLYIFEKKIKIKMHLTYFSFCYIIFLIASITTFYSSKLNSYYFVLYSYLHFNMTKTTIIQKGAFFSQFFVLSIIVK